jgi:hypothetical protein
MLNGSRSNVRWRDSAWSPASRALLWLLTGVIVGISGGESSDFRTFALILIGIALLTDGVLIVRRMKATRGGRDHSGNVR